MRDSAGGSVLFERLSVIEDLAADEDWMRDTLVVHGRWMIEVIRARDMPARRTAALSPTGASRRTAYRPASPSPWELRWSDPVSSSLVVSVRRPAAERFGA